MANVSNDTNLIVFDADCIFCSGFARFMAKHDRKAGFRFVSARSGLGRSLYEKHGLDPDALETNIVIFNGRAYTKMASFAASMKSLGRPWSFLAVVNLLPDSLANWAYDRIARNRYAFGKRSCPLPSSELKDRLID
ncbi:thiol-disulfide oxidoreductase DCC family protein [Roseibium sp.]|uniref:thiol-disulfide oxidoreductase DCC family protein n=1 Tax=Roseibium sp. TaxID=1936156 RepID=UPI003BAD61A9